MKLTLRLNMKDEVLDEDELKGRQVLLRCEDAWSLKQRMSYNGNGTSFLTVDYFDCRNTIVERGATNLSIIYTSCSITLNSIRRASRQQLP